MQSKRDGNADARGDEKPNPKPAGLTKAKETFKM
jgi:hypothetical protein